MKKQKLKSTGRLIEVINRMPDGLSHWKDKTIPFEAKNSEVVQWLIAQEDFLCWMFSKVESLGVLEYDKVSNTWGKAKTVTSQSRE